MKMFQKRCFVLWGLLGLLLGGTPGFAQDSAPSPAVEPDTTNLAPLAPEASTNGVGAFEQLKSKGHKSSQKRHATPGARVVFGRDVQIETNEAVASAVAIGGSVFVNGAVSDGVVSVLGDVIVRGGEVGDAVSVLGDVRAEQGGRIRGDAVSILGKVKVAPDSSVRGDSVSMTPFCFSHFHWLRVWISNCLFKLRPLAPEVGWGWPVAVAFGLLYLIIGVVFRRPVTACVQRLEAQPMTTFALGLIIKLLVPLLFVLLGITGAGLVVLPFLLAALFIASLIGKTALLQWLGERLEDFLHLGKVIRGGPAIVLGAAVVTLLYAIPVVGFLLFLLLGFWSLGCAACAMFTGVRQEASPLPPPPPPEPVPAPMPELATAPAFESSALPPVCPVPSSSVRPAVCGCSSRAEATVASLPPVIALPPPETLISPRAGFWLRMGAGLLDLVFVEILLSLAHLQSLQLNIFALVVYFTAMWAWKGTTLGGILLRTKVSRQDGSPMTLTVALVRALAALFSAFVLFLGFFWIGWNDEKQGWHDIIAGTVVLRTPRHTSLI